MYMCLKTTVGGYLKDPIPNRFESYGMPHNEVNGGVRRIANRSTAESWRPQRKMEISDHGFLWLSEFL